MKWLCQVLFYCCICFTKQSSASGRCFENKQLENISLTNTEQLSGVHSQMQCIMRCQRSTSEKKNAFHTDNGKCFCVSDEISESELGVGVLNGNLFSQVFIYIFLKTQGIQGGPVRWTLHNPNSHGES